MELLINVGSLNWVVLLPAEPPVATSENAAGTDGEKESTTNSGAVEATEEE